MSESGDLPQLDMDEVTGLPHYSHSTASSQSPAYANSEVEKIKNSYQCGNFSRLRNLPAVLAPGNVQAATTQHIHESRIHKPQKTYQAPVVPRSFSPLVYNHSNYSRPQQLQKEEREYHRLVTESFSRKPFACASSRIRLKNEDLFENETFVYPNLGPSKGKPSLESIVRKDFTDSKKLLAGPFRRVGRSTVSGETQSPAQIEEGSRLLFAKLSSDWGHLKFNIRLTSDDELLVTFAAEQVLETRCLDALVKYLLHDAKHGTIAKMHLRRRGDRWRVREDNEVVFSFYAPWVASAHTSVHKQYAIIPKQLKLYQLIRPPKQLHGIIVI